MAKPTGRLLMKVGERETPEGTKAIYEEVGSQFESERGPYFLIKAWALSPSLLSVANPESRASVMVSYWPNDRDQGGGGGRAPARGGRAPAPRGEAAPPTPARAEQFDQDDIPF